KSVSRRTDPQGLAGDEHKERQPTPADACSGLLEWRAVISLSHHAEGGHRRAFADRCSRRPAEGRGEARPSRGRYRATSARRATRLSYIRSIRGIATLTL